MADMLIRGLGKKVMDRLRARAKRHGRSVQGEVRQLLESEAARWSIDEALERARRFRGAGGRVKGDSADLVREDRER